MKGYGKPYPYEIGTKNAASGAAGTDKYVPAAVGRRL
jgi:hypothetical protein